MPNWSSVITNVSIPSTIAVYGNGKTLGFYDGTDYFGCSYFYGQNGGQNTNLYNTNIGSNNLGTNTSNAKSIGLTSDTSGKSGIVAKSNSITKTSKSFKFCIKY